MKARLALTTGSALALFLTFGALAGGGGAPAVHAQPSPPRPDQASASTEAGADRTDRRGARHDRRGRGAPALTDDQVEEAVALMVELDPSMAAKIQELRDQRPELLRRAVARRFPRIGHMLKLKESRPALYELRVRDIRLEALSRQQARALAALPEGDPAIDAARAQLRDTLDEHFTVRQEVRRAEIEILREQLAGMEAKRLDEASRREALVDQRLAQLEAQPPPEAPVAERLRAWRDRRAGDREGGDRGRAGQRRADPGRADQSGPDQDHPGHDAPENARRHQAPLSPTKPH